MSARRAVRVPAGTPSARHSPRELRRVRAAAEPALPKWPSEWSGGSEEEVCFNRDALLRDALQQRAGERVLREELDLEDEREQLRRLVLREPHIPPPQATFFETLRMLFGRKYRAKLCQAAIVVKEAAKEREDRESIRRSYGSRPRRTASGRF